MSYHKLVSLSLYIIRGAADVGDNVRGAVIIIGKKEEQIKLKLAVLMSLD